MAETDREVRVAQGDKIKMESEEERSSSGDRGSVVTLDPDTMEDQSNGTAEDTGTSTMRHREVTSKIKPPSDSEAKGAQMGEHPQTVRRNPRFAIRAATPTHRRPKESPLSSSAIFNESHAGLFNLCIVVLVAVNSRLIIENLMKYGLLMRKEFWLSSHSPRDFPLLLCGLTLPIFPLLSFVVEKWKAEHPKTNEKVVALLHCIIATVAFAYPAYIIHIAQSGPLGGFLLILNTVIVWMKLISYAHTNYDMRLLLASGEQPPPAADTAPTVHYPHNINLSDLAYFMAAPTLCYQLGYPRSPTIRKYWILRQVMKLVIFCGLILFIIEQYINPTIKNSHHPMKGHLVYSIERVLKLSIPTLYVWLCVFYCLFHLWLNILAEVLRFGDREFYKDWWNAKTIEEYWRSWNMPVHRWMVRHVYYPCLALGCTKSLAVFVVFLLSAIFHEVLVGLPCHMLRMWAFMGIIFQVPLVVLTNYLLDKYRQPMVGNMLFWFFFCIVGQPTCLLLYYHDVQVRAQQS